MSNLIDLARKLRPYIVKAAQSLSDADALRAAMLYAPWKPDTEYAKDYKVNREGRVYKVLQPHTSRVGWEPENAPALWTEICESHAGTFADPIPYSGNMELTAGLYYVQTDVVYLCTRSTGAPVHHNLSELMGLYVEKAKEA